MKEKDFRLSMAISPRAKADEDNAGWRSLLLHRLTEGSKLIWRRSLTNEKRGSLFCEHCRAWTVCNEVPIEWQCQKCERWYRIEFASYEEMESEDDDDRGGHDSSGDS